MKKEQTLTPGLKFVNTEPMHAALEDSRMEQFQDTCDADVKKVDKQNHGDVISDVRYIEHQNDLPKSQSQERSQECDFVMDELDRASDKQNLPLPAGPASPSYESVSDVKPSPAVR